MNDRTLTADQLVDFATADPRSSAGRGRLRFASMIRLDPREAGLRQAIEAQLTATAPVDVPARHEPNLTASNHDPKTKNSRDLTPAETAWIATLPTNPAKVTPEDARRLAGLYREARTEVDRHVVRERLDPVRELHRKRAEVVDAERELTLASVYDPRTSAIAGPWPAWRQAIAARLAAEVPELTEAETLARAERIVGERVDAAKARRDAARRRLADTLRRYDAKSDLYPDAPRWPGMGA